MFISSIYVFQEPPRREHTVTATIKGHPHRGFVPNSEFYSGERVDFLFEEGNQIRVERRLSVRARNAIVLDVFPSPVYFILCATRVIN